MNNVLRHVKGDGLRRPRMARIVSCSMTPARTSLELFSVPGGIAGTPNRLAAASFSSLGALELQDIERWIRDRPLLVGEELIIVSNQFAQFDGSKDRLDVLALDRAGRLVVIEVKRDVSGAYQDLQALRYAAFVSTFRAEQLSQARPAYVLKSEGRAIDGDDARGELEGFIEGGDLDVVDEDEQPRVILVAAGFQPGVTSTVLWLRRAFSVDISCVDPAADRGQPPELLGPDPALRTQRCLATLAGVLRVHRGPRDPRHREGAGAGFRVPTMHSNRYVPERA